MAFRGWPAEALEFYEGLEADNSKTYWTAHRDVYERQVREPMLALLGDLEAEFGPGRMFRPYRDVRFSADKSPYKTHAGALLDNGGYVQLSALGLAAGRGMYAMRPEELARYRAAVAGAAAGPDLPAAIAAVEAAGVRVRGSDPLKTAPKGYPKDHPRIELLRYKGIYAWREWPVAAWLGTRAAATRVAEFLRAAAPLTDWLSAHVRD